MKGKKNWGKYVFFLFFASGAVSAIGGLGLLEGYEDHCSMMVMGPPPFSYRCGEFTCESEEHETIHCFLSSAEENGDVFNVFQCPNWNTWGGQVDGYNAWTKHDSEIECQRSGGSGKAWACRIPGEGHCVQKVPIPPGVWVYPCECVQKTKPPK